MHELPLALRNKIRCCPRGQHLFTLILLQSRSFLILYVFDDIAEITFKRRADTVQNVTVEAYNAVIVITVYRLKFNVGSLG